MAANATYDSGVDDIERVEKWQKLFGYTAEEASKKIEEQREDLTAMVSEALWETVKEHQEALGHDRESYSHWLRLPRTSSRLVASGTNSDGCAEEGQAGQEYLLRLEDPIDSTEKVREIAGLPTPPKTFEGLSESDDMSTSFCKVDATTKHSLLTWLSQHHPTFRPMFILRSLARKDLSATSSAPMLGLDTTLPQHRLTTPDSIPRPAQDEYPVWYFFYGTLVDRQTLHNLLQHLDGEGNYDLAKYKLRPARVCGAKLTTWGNKYKAVIDGEGDEDEDVVEGWAFSVKTEMYEEALRSYETGAYEVVRCRIRCRAAGSSDDEGNFVWLHF